MKIESTGTAISPDQGDQTLVSGAFSAGGEPDPNEPRSPGTAISPDQGDPNPHIRSFFGREVSRTRMSRAPGDPSDRVGGKGRPRIRRYAALRSLGAGVVVRNGRCSSAANFLEPGELSCPSISGF